MKDGSATRFALLLLSIYELRLCRNRKTIQPADVVSFYFTDIQESSKKRGISNEVWNHIAHDGVSREQFTTSSLHDMARYFYNRVSWDIKRRALASLLHCLDIRFHYLINDSVDIFESCKDRNINIDSITSLHHSDANAVQCVVFITTLMRHANSFRLSAFQNIDVSQISNVKVWQVALFVVTEMNSVVDLLQNAPAHIKDDEKILLLAIKSTGHALMFASPRLKDNNELVLTAVTQNGRALEFVSPRLRDDDTTVMRAVTQNGVALHYASPRLQDDETLVNVAVKNNGIALRYASNRLRQHLNTVVTALKQQPGMLEEVPAPLKYNETIVMAAVTQNGLALMFASKQFKNKANIVLTAVKQNGLSLEYASPRLKDQENIVLTAIKQNGLSLEYASPRLKALWQNGETLSNTQQSPVPTSLD